MEVIEAMIESAAIMCLVGRIFYGVCKELHNFDINIFESKFAADYADFYYVFTIMVFGISPLAIAAPDILLNSVRLLSYKQIFR